MPDDLPSESGEMDLVQFPDEAPNTTSASLATDLIDGAPSGPDSELDAAMTAIDFTAMSDADLDALGSGDRELIDKALNLESAPTRISLRAISDPEERRAIADATRLVRDGKHTSLRTALIEVMNLHDTASAEGEVAHPDEGTDPDAAPALLDETPAAVEAQITGLEADLQRAREYFDYDQALAIQDQIVQLKSGLRETEMNVVQHQAQVAAYAEVEEFSRASAISAFPQLGNPESEFAQLVEDEIVLAEYRNSDLLLSPDWPEKIAVRVNQKHGNKFGGGTAEPGGARSSRSIPAPPLKPGVRMPGSPVGPGANTSALTAHTALAAFDQLSLEEQDAVLTQLDMSHQRRGRF